MRLQLYIISNELFLVFSLFVLALLINYLTCFLILRGNWKMFTNDFTMQNADTTDEMISREFFLYCNLPT